MLTVSDVYYNQDKLHNKADDLIYERNQIINNIPFINYDERFGMTELKNPFIENDGNPKVNPFIHTGKNGRT